MQVLGALLLLPCVAWALCETGSAGHDGLDFNITVVHDKTTGCTTQRLPGITAPVIVCNGTNTAQCPPPVISTTGLPAGCASVTGVGSATFCNVTSATAGSTGSTGLKGITGATGPLLTLTNPTPLCQLMTNGAGSFVVICNGTSNTTGATGAQGLQGPAGVNGSTGATGPQGAAGYEGFLPNYYILDPDSNFLYNNGGLQSALNAVSAAGGGVLYLGPCYGTTCGPPGQLQQLTSNCASPIVVPGGVILDLGGNEILMTSALSSGLPIPCAPLVQLGSGTPTITLNVVPLIANSSIGSTTVTISSSIGIAAALATGQMCQLSFGWVAGVTQVNTGASATIIQQLARVQAFNNATGVITLRKPLIGTFGTSNTLNSVITCWSGFSTGAQIRNGYLSYGGNTHTSSYAIGIGSTNAEGSVNSAVSDITIVGPGVAGSASQAITAQLAIDMRLENVFIDSVASVGLIVVGQASGLTMRNVHLSNSVAGLQLVGVSSSTFQDIVIDGTSAIGLSLSVSLSNTFKNIQVANCAGSGIQLTNRAGRNVFQGVTVTGGAGYGIQFANRVDNNNQFYGMIVRNNALGPVQFGATDVGNYLDGDIQGSPSSLAPGGSGLLADTVLGNMIRQTTGVNGFVGLALHNTTVSTTDFPGNRHVIFSVVDDATLKLSYLSSAGVLKTATVALS